MVAPDEIPQEIIDLLDRRAGKTHNRNGSVVTTLAEILTLWEDLNDRSGWWTSADIAQILGIQQGTWRAYVSRGQAPPPERYFGRSPAWRPKTIVKWARLAT